MATYHELARAIAADVAEGRLQPGATVEPLRSLARSRGASQATALRAYRELADAGVIETSERRVARVAAEGPLAAARFLRHRPAFRLAGGGDAALAELVAGVEPSIVWVGEHDGAAGLRAVVEGRADGAAIHLWHVSGEYNVPYARGLIADPVLVHLWRRERGLVLAPGNPRRVAGARDLGGLRVARHPIGTGTRSVLDRLTAAAGIVLDASDPEVATDLDAAVAVAAGSVDAGVSDRDVAARLGLAFVPLTVEPVEIVTSRTALAGLETLRRLLHDPGTRTRLAARHGYDLADAGALIDFAT